MNNNKLVQEVQDGLNYFLSFRIDEMKSDDQYYLTKMIEYIEHLESELLEKSNEKTK